MLNRFKISTKLYLLIGFCVVFLFLLSCVGINVAIQSEKRTATVYKDRIVPLQQLKNISDMYAIDLVDTAHKVRNGNITWDEGIKNLDDVEKTIKDEWSKYLNTFLVYQEIELIEETNPLMKKADGVVANLRVIFNNHNRVALDKLVVTDLYTSIDPLTKKFSNFVELQISVAEEERAKANRLYEQTKEYCILLLSLGMLVLSNFAWIIVRSITAPLAAGVLVAKRLSHGDLAVDVVVTGRDEISVFMSAMKSMAEDLLGYIKGLTISEEKYRSLVDNLNVGVFRSSPEPDGFLIHFNPALMKMFEYDSVDELKNVPVGHLCLNPQQGPVALFEVFRSKGFIRGRELELKKKTGVPFYVKISGTAQHAEDGTLKWIDGVLEDITKVKQNEAERVILEEQLRQSQKMETVGLLAGGIAHDFNNLLTPILGYSELLLADLPREDSRYLQIQRINKAAKLSSDLTKRLLAFSRKQVFELKIVDLGDLVRRSQNLIRGLIRENIAIEVKICPDTSLVKVDAIQIEQVLINLSVNAEDAMPDGGKLMIEIKDIQLERIYTDPYPEIEPGNYVMMTVGDTGNGINKETIPHIFEPFYSTKELGKGTGLGLSTVYGIVKQHRGSINVFSEHGQGTIFKIFLPAISGGQTCLQQHYTKPRLHSREGETILVVDDNDGVRLLVGDLLTAMGYNVLSADTPATAFELVKGYEGNIQLLLTDVVMPQMNGRVLYERLRCMQNDLKVIFMSGYSNSVITDQGILKECVNFIQKPILQGTLSEKVRQVMDNKYF